MVTKYKYPPNSIDTCLTQGFISRSGKQLRSGRTKVKRTEALFRCKRCDEAFFTKPLLTKHKKEVHLHQYDEKHYNYSHNVIEDNYTCKTCDAEFDTKQKVEEHILCHEEKYECSICSEVFHSPYKFSQHMQKHTNGSFCCPLCSFKTARATSILQHINRLHLRKYLYYCKYCGKGFGDALICREHEQIHEGGQSLRCIVCQKEFNFTRNLTLHQTKMHVPNILGVAPKNQCSICKKAYSKAETLEKHVKSHHTAAPRLKKHLCDNCGKGFQTNDKLTVHYRVHTGYKPYQCSYCEKSFTKKDYLVMHERIHSGEKPYCCTYCGRCFNQDASLRIHVRTHTGERPYVCHLCGNSYVSGSSLKMHLNNCSGFPRK